MALTMDFWVAVLLALILTTVAVLYSPWMLLSLLLLVPVLKIALMNYIPALQVFDPTPITCGAVGLAALLKWYRLRRNGNPLAIPRLMLCGLIILGAMMVIGLLWSTAPDYGFRKTSRFCGIGIPFLLLPTFLIRERRDIRSFGRSIMYSALVAMILIVVIPQSDLSAERYGATYIRATPLGSDPIQPALLTGMGTIVVTAFLLKCRLSQTKRLLGIGFLAIALLAIMLSGTRSVIIGLILPIGILCAASGRITFLKASVIAALGVVAALLLIEFAAGIGPDLSERWSSFWVDLQQGNVEKPFESRWDHYEFCLSKWDQQPILGHGTGSFAMDFFGQDDPGWPHNIVLEALYELGITGVTGLVIFLAGALRTGTKAFRMSLGTGGDESAMLLALTGILAFFAAQGMVHSDLDGMRNMFLMGGALQAGLSTVIRTAVSIPRNHESAQGSRRSSGPGSRAWVTPYGG